MPFIICIHVCTDFFPYVLVTMFSRNSFPELVCSNLICCYHVGSGEADTENGTASHWLNITAKPVSCLLRVGKVVLDLIPFV